MSEGRRRTGTLAARDVDDETSGSEIWLYAMMMATIMMMTMHGRIMRGRTRFPRLGVKDSFSDIWMVDLDLHPRTLDTVYILYTHEYGYLYLRY